MSSNEVPSIKDITVMEPELRRLSNDKLCLEVSEETGSVDEDSTVEHSTSDLPLPDGWCETLPKADHGWVARALFKTNHTSRKAELNVAPEINTVWWEPPSPSRTGKQLPKSSSYFAQPLLLWMPGKIWGVKFTCPEPSCLGNELISVGIHHRVRQVLDFGRYYNMAAECLECSNCKKTRMSWSRCLVEQLHVGYQVQFPVIMMYDRAFDVSVLRYMRQRSLGYSSYHLYELLIQEHRESWLSQSIKYLTDCRRFKNASDKNTLITFEDPPEPVPVPSAQWLLTAYTGEILSRLEQIKSCITSTFGTIVRMDSTNKVTKKLAGHSASTVYSTTTVVNEHAQVLISVLTCNEGVGLAPMVTGLMKRYKLAAVPPPQLLYVDQHCCENDNVKLRELFSDWPDLVIRLDISHYMRRFAAGCIADDHPLYPKFMGKLSRCIFVWSTEDLERLKTARKYEMQSQGIKDPSELDVVRSITKKEWAMHCRRWTRGAEESSRLIHDLLTTFSGPQGSGILSIPLLDSKRIWHIWESQKRHLHCIQDPDDVSLYTQIETITRGGIELPVYRCGRCSTSLESFHRHLNKFIPGTCASDMHFQAYLLEGLVQWNSDHAAQSNGSMIEYPRAYTKILNTLHRRFFGHDVYPSTSRAGTYTGELIGIEYLYSQKGKILQDYSHVEEDVSPLLADEDRLADVFIVEEDDPTIVAGMVLEVEGSSDEKFVTLTHVPATGLGVASSSLETIGLRGAGKSMLELDSSVPATGQELASVSTTEDEVSSSKDKLLHLPSKTRPYTHGNTMLEDTLDADIISPASTSATELQVASISIAEEPGSDIHRVSEQQSDNTVTEFLSADSIGGYDKVDRLADCLADLRHSSVLSESQAALVVELWSNLEEHDKQPTLFNPRDQLTQTGKAEVLKSKQTLIPEDQNAERSFIGSRTGNTQWPDCHRYVEATVTKLCEIFPNAQQEQGSTILPWSLITRAYKSIRQCIINNDTVMTQTSIQLPEINDNRTTLLQWYNKIQKETEKDDFDRKVVQQPTPLKTETIPPASMQPAAFPVTSSDQLFILFLPTNTPSCSENIPNSAQCYTPSCNENIPKSTQYYRRKRIQAILQGDLSHKRYAPRKKPTVCKKCGNERDPKNHKQFYGNWFCQKSSIISYDEWLASLKEKGCGKKKTSKTIGSTSCSSFKSTRK